MAIVMSGNAGMKIVDLLDDDATQSAVRTKTGDGTIYKSQLDDDDFDDPWNWRSMKVGKRQVEGYSYGV